MKHVFVSYRHEDMDFAETLIHKIEQAGFETWIDNDRLLAGEDWRTKIDQAIKNAFALIVIMTPEAKASEYVTYEWSLAWGAGVKVIPILYKATVLHPRLEALNYLDFTYRSTRPWDALIIEVKSAAQGFPPSSPITPRSDKKYEYDIAISYAGEDRHYANTLANALHKRNVNVFYDRYEQHTLWGQDLYVGTIPIIVYW